MKGLRKNSNKKKLTSKKYCRIKESELRKKNKWNSLKKNLATLKKKYLKNKKSEKKKWSFKKQWRLRLSPSQLMWNNRQKKVKEVYGTRTIISGKRKITQNGEMRDWKKFLGLSNTLFLEVSFLLLRLKSKRELVESVFEKERKLWALIMFWSWSGV